MQIGQVETYPWWYVFQKLLDYYVGSQNWNTKIITVTSSL